MNRHLYSGPSEKKGNLVLYPHQKIILRMASDQRYRHITVVASQQIGKTEMILCIFTYYVDQEPLPQMIVEDTLKPAAENFSLGRIDTAIHDTPCLRGKFMDLDKKKKSGNTKFRKDYPGGPLILAGANSVSSLSGNPVAVVQLDELSKYKVTKQGFSSDIASGRTTSFRLKAKIFSYSTPTTFGSCEITDKYETSNQGVFLVECVHCSEAQEFVFTDQTFKYTTKLDRNGRKLVKEAWYECASCHKAIDERQRMQMIAGEKPFFKNPEVEDHLGFQVWAMYNPDVPMKHIAQEYLACFDKNGNIIPEKLKTFTNNWLGQAYKETDSSRDPNQYSEKTEEYSKPDERMILITVSVDTQAKYFQYRYVGWGYLEEPYLLHGGKIEGDTKRTDTIMRMYDVLNAPIEYKNGYKARPYIMVLDANFNSDKVHFLVRKLSNEGNNAFAIVGRSYPKLPEFIKSRYSHKKYHTRFAYLNVDRLADRINDWCEPDEKTGKLGIHFSEEYCDPEFFEQFFSEHRIEVKSRGKVAHYKWEPKTKGLRNEESDLMRYNLAGIKIMEPLNWDRLKKDFEKRMAKFKATPKAERNQPIVKKPKSRTQDSFIKGYDPKKY